MVLKYKVRNGSFNIPRLGLVYIIEDSNQNLPNAVSNVKRNSFTLNFPTLVRRNNLGNKKTLYVLGFVFNVNRQHYM